MAGVQDPGKQRRRRGRPPAPPGMARSHRVVTFVTDSEFTQLQSLSSELDAPLSATVHQLLSQCLSDAEKKYN